jgi:hypothetical protein
MRDAVTLEARGTPTIILVNDVFAPIAHATAALLALPPDYVAKNIVWLPHPTSNLTAAAAAALIDQRIEGVRAALLGLAQPAPLAAPANAVTGGGAVVEEPALSVDSARPADAAVSATANGSAHFGGSEADSAALALARDIVEGLAQSLRADGADLVLLHFGAGVLVGEVRIGELTCDDGSCIMPTDALAKMVEAMVKPKVSSLRVVTLRETVLEK